MNTLHTLWIPVAVTSLAVVVLLLDVLTPPRAQHADASRALGWLVAIALAALFGATFFVPETRQTVSGYANGPWTTFVQRLVLAAGSLGALGALDDVARRTPRRQGEYWLLLLSSLLGMVIVAGARELILLVTSFELMGIPLYVLAAYAKTDAAPAGDSTEKARAAEASLKLYLVGATSSAISLFGLALLSGMAGTTQLAALAAAPTTPLGTLGMVFVVAGLGYKIGMVPFHMWVPDTYQGAATPFVAFLSVAPKAAGISVFCTLFGMGLGSQRAAWLPPLALGALLSMTIGNLLALGQTDLRRLLGYSGIAQVGVLLVAVAAGDRASASMTLFFLASYVVTNLGAFLVVHAASEAGVGFGFSSLHGLWRRSPGLAAALLCFLLSLAGIPFVVGFWAKLYVFLAAWNAGMVGVVMAGVALTLLGLFYYLQVLRAAYLVEESTPLPTLAPAQAVRLAIVLCVAAVVGFGVHPRPLVEAASRAGDALIAGDAR